MAKPPPPVNPSQADPPPVNSPPADPPLGPALAAMTALQAIVSLALFAPGVLAPQLGIDARALSGFAFACFASGMVCALQGGRLVGQLGPFRVAAFCMLCVGAAMSICLAATGWSLVLAGLVLGLAFGPETPASSALLGRLASAGQRPMVFSIRQTGNQLGAILGSLTLPALALVDPGLGYGLVVALALCGLAVFLVMSRGYDHVGRQDIARLSIRQAAGLLKTDRNLAGLALIALPLSAMQLALNGFLVTFLVVELAAAPVVAGLILGVAQAGGLAGRLFWARAAGGFSSVPRLVALLAMGAAVFALAFACLPPGLPPALAAALAFAFGLTASGWNGIFLAEIAATAPEGRMAEATGAILTASYAGLLLGPLLILLLDNAGGLRLSYAVLALPCLAAGLWLWKTATNPNARFTRKNQ